MRVLIVVLCLFLGSCVSDGRSILRHELGHCNGWIHGSDDLFVLPPMQYDHQPVVPVQIVHVDDIQTQCGSGAMACTIPGRLGCTIYLPR